MTLSYPGTLCFCLSGSHITLCLLFKQFFQKSILLNEVTLAEWQNYYNSHHDWVMVAKFLINIYKMCSPRYNRMLWALGSISLHSEYAKGNVIWHGNKKHRIRETVNSQLHFSLFFIFSLKTDLTVYTKEIISPFK